MPVNARLRNGRWREAEQRELERLNRIAMLRSEAFRDIPCRRMGRFENAEVMTPNSLLKQ